MAPTWRLIIPSLVLSLLLTGAHGMHPLESALNMTKDVAHRITGDITDLFGSEFGDIKKLVEDLGELSDCAIDLVNFTRSCIITAAKDLPEFERILHMFGKLIKEPTTPNKRRKRMTGNAYIDEYEKVFNRFCKPAYTFALCMSHHLCTSNCTATLADTFLVKGKAMAERLFHDPKCTGRVPSVAELGCKEVSIFRRFNAQCDKKVARDVAQCKKSAPGKARKSEPRDRCLETFYSESCIAQVKCDLCETMVATVAQTVAQAKIDASYVNCSAQGFKARSAKCLNIGLVVGLSVGGAVALVVLVVVWCCCCFRKAKTTTPVLSEAPPKSVSTKSKSKGRGKYASASSKARKAKSAASSSTKARVKSAFSLVKEEVKSVSLSSKAEVKSSSSKARVKSASLSSKKEVKSASLSSKARVKSRLSSQAEVKSASLSSKSKSQVHVKSDEA